MYSHHAADLCQVAHSSATPQEKVLWPPCNEPENCGNSGRWEVGSFYCGSKLGNLLILTPCMLQPVISFPSSATSSHCKAVCRRSTCRYRGDRWWQSDMCRYLFSGLMWYKLWSDCNVFLFWKTFFSPQARSPHFNAVLFRSGSSSTKARSHFMMHYHFSYITPELLASWQGPP